MSETRLEKKTLRPLKTRTRLLLTGALVLPLMACSGISQPQNVDGLRQTIGNELPGAKGLTIADQEAIDDTVARGCRAGVWEARECDLHTKASIERRFTQ